MGLSIATPRQLEHEHTVRRRTALTITAVVSFANIYSLVALTHFLLHHDVEKGRELITSGVLIWLTNFLIFALWYWELDRGGPGRRPPATTAHRTSSFRRCPTIAPSRCDWRPKFIDYLFMSLTSHRLQTDRHDAAHAVAKSLMGVQSLASLLTVALVVSHAMNILN